MTHVERDDRNNVSEKQANVLDYGENLDGRHPSFNTREKRYRSGAVMRITGNWWTTRAMEWLPERLTELVD